MNQTKFEPIFKYMGVQWWRVSHLSDTSYMLNNDAQAGGNNSEAQKQLSALLDGSAAAFAHTSDPTKSDRPVLRDWPTAYGSHNKSAPKKEFPDSMTVNVIGGSFGTGSVLVSKDTKKASSSREKAVECGRVLHRCEFINSILEEVSV